MITLVDILHKEYSKIIGADKEHKQAEVIRNWLESAQCPNEKCHAIGQFNNHGYYTRGFEDVATTENHDRVLTVLRGKCKSCGTTHAFLPADAIPYKWPLISYFLMVLVEQFSRQKENTDRDTKIQDGSKAQVKNNRDDDEYYYKGPFSLRMAYRNLELLNFYLKYLQHTLRDLQLWAKAHQPELWEAVEILLATDIHLIQKRTLELHHTPLFFRRKRTATGIPHTGMLKTG